MDLNACLYAYNKILVYTGDIEFANVTRKLMETYPITFQIGLATTPYLHQLENNFGKFLTHLKLGIEYLGIHQIVRKYLGTRPRHIGITNDYFTYCQSIFTFINLQDKNKEHKIKEIFHKYFRNHTVEEKDIKFFIDIIYKYTLEKLTMDEKGEDKLVEEHIEILHNIIENMEHIDDTTTSVSTEDYLSDG